MKTLRLKQALTAGLLVTGLSIMTSCNNKHETDGSSNEQGTELTGPSDTTATTGGDNSEDAIGTGSATGTGGTGATGGSGGTDGAGSTGSGGDTGSAKGTGGSAAGSNGSASTYSPSNDPIENTSRPSADRQGKPVISSGSAGSGMGTGTGSTGNNSRVRTAEEQRS